MEIRDRSVKQAVSTRRKADPSQPGEVGAPIPGVITVLHVSVGEEVKKGDRLLAMEAMKMQTTIYAPIAGKVSDIRVKPRDNVEAHELLVTITPTTS